MKGMMFIEPLFLRVISGDKTMTRRDGGLDAVNGCDKKNKKIVTNPDYWKKVEGKFVDGRIGFYQSFELIEKPWETMETCYSSHNVGDIVFLKEPTYKYKSGQIVYQYGNPDFNPDFPKWGNKMFMGVDRARHFIRITGVRCERLKEISTEDCLAEGIEVAQYWEGKPIYKNYLPDSPDGLVYSYMGEDEKLSFFSLYMFANRVKEVPNLWVWVYEFVYLKDFSHGEVRFKHEV